MYTSTSPSTKPFPPRDKISNEVKQMSLSHDQFMLIARSPKDLEDIALQRARAPAAADSATLLEVRFRDDCGPLPLALGTVLQYLPNLTILVLDFPLPIPPLIFADISLPRLEVFKSNLPHTNLLHLLGRDSTTRRACSSILSLTLNSATCDVSQTCPLTSCSLDNVTELVCPFECVASLARGKLVRLTSWKGRGTPAISEVMRGWRRSQSLSVLSVTVPSGDSSVLEYIPNIAPNVRTLKVVEIQAVNVPLVSQSTITQAYKAWARVLGCLKKLDSLLVRTHCKVIRDQGSLEQEREMLLSWLTGKRNQKTHRLQTKYPIRIGIQYGEEFGGAMSYWATGKTFKRFCHVSPTDCNNYLL